MASPNVKKRIIDLLSKGIATTGFYGLPDLGTDPELVEGIYLNSDYDPSELIALQNWYAARNIPVTGEYPRYPEILAAVIVQRIKDGESPKGVMGDSFGLQSDTAIQSTFRRGYRGIEQFKVSIWAINNTDARDALYLAVRELLLQGRGYIENCDNGVEMMTFISGQDNQMEIKRQDPLIVHQAEIYLEVHTKTTWLVTEDKLTGCTSTSTFKQWRDDS